MDKDFLLTYESNTNRWLGVFAWFKTKEEMLNFIEEFNVTVIEAYKITGIEKLKIPLKN